MSPAVRMQPRVTLPLREGLGRVVMAEIEVEIVSNLAEALSKPCIRDIVY